MRPYSNSNFYSIGKKILMSLSGLFLFVFLVEHLIGNLLLLKGDEGAAFIEYSHNMVHNILIRAIEVVLFLAILVHVIDGIMISLKNKKSRPVGYAANKPSGNSKWNSRNMIWTGLFILVFLVIHLSAFFWPYRITGLEENVTIFDLAVHKFQQPVFTIFYIVAFILLGFHLQHGFYSAFQTLGLRNSKYYPLIMGAGWFFTVVLTIGFTIIPLYFLFIY